MIEWFADNKIILNLQKTNIMKFVTKNMPHCPLTIGYKYKYVEEVVSTKFLNIRLDNHLNWKDHIDQIIPKLSSACYAVRQIYYFINQNTLKSIFFAYFHSVVKYGIMFWGNLSNSRKIFTLQKKIIRIMVGAHPRTSCRRLFKNLEILSVPSQYIYSLMNFFVKKIFRQTHQYTTLIREISTTFIGRLLTYLVFRKMHSILGSEFLTVYHKAIQILKMKRQSIK
jgi:hypothetical protein